jgi:hypothetical protein
MASVQMTDEYRYCRFQTDEMNWRVAQYLIISGVGDD